MKAVESGQNAVSPAAKQVVFETLARIVRHHRVIIALILVHAAIAYLLLQVVDEPSHNELSGQLAAFVLHLMPTYLFILLLLRVGYMVIRVRPARPLSWLLEDLRRIILDSDRLLGGALIYLLLTFFMVNFAAIKDMIPQMNPFAWDVALADVDSFVHFGTDPWRLLWPVVGSDLSVYGLNLVHTAWFYVTTFGTFFLCFSRGWKEIRLQYLVAFVLTWSIAGNLVATLFSSVGPVYFERLGLGDRFAPLMDHLRMVDQVYPLKIVFAQDLLWQGYVSNGPIQGISAFPSMHVASTALVAMAAWQMHRGLGWIMAIFTGLVLIDTVALAWHYAADGYAALILTFGLWKIAGAIAKREIAATAR